MARVQWPTHKAKARQRKNVALYFKKRGKKIRRLYRDGKRGEIRGAA